MGSGQVVVAAPIELDAAKAVALVLAVVPMRAELAAAQALLGAADNRVRVAPTAALEATAVGLSIVALTAGGAITGAPSASAARTIAARLLILILRPSWNLVATTLVRSRACRQSVIR
jgi:hypothetical protein